MTGEISFYFPAVAITMLVTGVMAWIAWQHPPLPGVRAFALMGVDVFLMAMVEIFSMVSPQQEQAQFWFKVRALFISLIPVLYVIFAFRYHGHGTWLSRRVFALLFVIPVVSQVVIWVPALHPLWAIQDTIFVHIGAFWISLEATVIPGAWYMVDAIYSLLLLLVAAIVMFLAAWNKKGTFLWQSILLSAGAVVGLGLALVPLFDLLPNLNFNILIPGLGFISLLYAMAVLRFRLLRTSVDSELISEDEKFKLQERRSLAFILVVYMVTITGIATIGYFSYKSFTVQLQQQAEYQLESIAKLKIDGLTDWRNERQGDAEAISDNPAFPLLVADYLRNPDGPYDSQAMQSWLDTLKNSYKYERVLFLDVDGTVRFTSPKEDVLVTPHLLDHVAESLATGEVTWIDFHRHDGQYIHLTLISPVFAGQALNQPLGTVIFYIDPNVWLYPYLQEWPAESQTAETLLVRQEGDEAVFLNPTRFDPESALNLRIPSSQSQVNAVKAILGTRGIVEGLDYRGQPVVSAIYTIPDTPWILIARMDKAEINAPARIRLWQIVVFFGFLILALGSSLGLFWRRNRMREYKDKLIATEALRKSEEKFRKAFDTSPDAVLISCLADGKVISINEGFTKTMGYTNEETVGMSTLDLDIWVDQRDREKLVSKLQETGSVKDLAAKFRKKNNEIIDGITSAATIEIDETPHILSTTRDVTEQKAAEKLIQEYSSHLEEMVAERTRELNKAQERLLRQERLAALGQLAGSIAHELRNPLGVISNATAYLSMIQPEADEKVREYIEIIQSETRTSEKIIADLMDYARLQTVERKPADISEIIRNAQRRNPAPGHVEVSTEVPSGLPQVLVNATQIEQVIGNLLTNAYQAMPTGGKLLLKAEFSMDSAEVEWIKITMKDTGEGIAQEDMERIFEPLFTTKVKGIGLGLAVSKKIVDANYGLISVESQPGKGSTFTLHLPIQKEKK
jgi:PAS domain S-box-containing protein